MTPEQKKLVRYAEVMGWRKWTPLHEDSRQPVDTYWLRAGSLMWVDRFGKDGTYWNPLTDANDALELAEKMSVAFEYHPNNPVDKRYAAWLDPLEYCIMPTLTAAICAAVDAALERE